MDKPAAMIALGASASAMHAPGGGAAARRLPSCGEEFPSLEDHLSPPEISGEETVRGERIRVMGAQPAHADPHSRLVYVLNAHVAPGYVSSCDLQTRFTLDSDFAPDASVRREGDDPQTGERYLEELAFEVVSTQRLTGKRGVTPKAEDMLRRGVRRIFGIFVKEGRIKEWRGAWLPVARGMIQDRCLLLPLPVRALLGAAVGADDAVAEALIRKRVPAIRSFAEQGEERGERRGEERGRTEEARAAVYDLCEALSVRVTALRRSYIEGLDLEALRALRQQLKQQRRWPRG